MKEHRLPEAELTVMKAIWASGGPMTSAQIMREAGEGRGWKPQTLLTLLTRLTARGFSEARPGKGQEKLFCARISREEYLTRETSAFMDEVHGHSISSLLAALHPDRMSRNPEQKKERMTDELYQ